MVLVFYKLVLITNTQEDFWDRVTRGSCRIVVWARKYQWFRASRSGVTLLSRSVMRLCALMAYPERNSSKVAVFHLL